MATEVTNQRYINKPVSAGYFESSKKRLFARAAAVAGMLAMAGTSLLEFPSMAMASPPMKEVGVLENGLLTRDLSKAQQIAQMIKAAGFNSVEIRENYVRGEAGNVENDWQAFCNAAEAAQDNGLHEYVIFQGYWENGRPGYVSTDPLDDKKLNLVKVNTTMVTYVNGLAGPTAEQAPKGAHRCPGLKNPVTDVELSLLNEPNDSFFMQPQCDTNGNYIAADEMVNLYAYEYPRLKALAKKLGIKLTIAAGGLNPDITKPFKHDPNCFLNPTVSNGMSDIDFINYMGQAIKNEHIQLPIFDVWDRHGYYDYSPPQTVHPDASHMGPADTPMMLDALNNVLGYRPPTVGGESGVESNVPNDKLSLYGAIMPNDPSVDEAIQGQEYHDALAIEACTTGDRGSYNTHLIDDNAAVPWARSGFYYPPPSPDFLPINAMPKTSLAMVEQANKAALNGTIADCSTPH